MPVKDGNVDGHKLTDLVVRAFTEVGLPNEDARLTATMLVRTDLRGVDSHGVARLASYYIRALKDGRINSNPKTEVISQAPATAVVEGDRGLGFVVGNQAMNEAIRRAETAGAGFVSVRNSTHFGAAFNYAMIALEHDMIGISMTDSIMDVVPPGSNKPGIGTNPIAVAAPAAKRAHFILDMATSVVAAGKLQIARWEGKPIPEGWAIDGEGKPLTEPDKWVRGEGGLLPLGGTPDLRSFKGFGLATVVEILSALLSGSPATLLRQTSPEARSGSNHFFGAFKIASFLPLEDFRNSMDDMIEAFGALPRLPGVEKVYVAGEYEAEIERERRVSGIPLHSSVVASLKTMSEELGIEYDL